MRNIIFLCLIIVFFTSCQGGNRLDNLVSKNEKAIFQVFSYDEYGAPVSRGSGFFINKDGTGLTNLHVLSNAKFAFIRDINDSTYQIERITRISEDFDLAEFKISTSKTRFPTLKIMYKVPPKGSDIFVIGSPEGLANTVSKGIVSGIQEANKIIQISAPISPGNSGSPIMDMTGKVFAMASFQHTEGQNLNFGYFIEGFNKLENNVDYTLSSETNRNLYIINEASPTESNLILNSIEVNEKNTVLNLTFINTSLAFGDSAFIFTVIDDPDQSFKIEDKISKKKYLIYDATIGGSAENPTYLKLGEARRFKLYFPAIGDSKILNIYEGMEGGSWSFNNLDLNRYKAFSLKENSFINDFYFQTGLSYLTEENYIEAYTIFRDFAAKNNKNDYAHNLAGIVSFILGNNLDALLHIKKALEINPTNDHYYFNLYFINLLNENPEEALKNITSAIQLNNNQPEYYAYRANLYMGKESWKEAISDLNKVIDSERKKTGSIYFQRAVAKLWLQDRSACKDFEMAYSLEESAEARATIREWYNKYCR